MARFRFEDLDIWKNSIRISDQIFNISDDLQKRHYYRWAEQLRASGLSISNNIAEGSGSNSKKEFIHFLNISRRSVFETANVLFILVNREIIKKSIFQELIENLEKLSKKIYFFQKSLKSQL
jgi:four helix bundle protein